MAPAEAEAGRNLAGAVLEYARGISVVKSFGKSGASMEADAKGVPRQQGHPPRH